MSCNYCIQCTDVALASAISSAGIELFGSPSGHPVNGDTPAKTK